MSLSSLQVEPPEPEEFGTSRPEVEAYEATVDRLTTLQARLIVLGGPLAGLLWVFLVEEATVRFGGVLFVPAYMVAGLVVAAVVLGPGGMLLWHVARALVPAFRRVRAFRSARSEFRSWWTAEPPVPPGGHLPSSAGDIEPPGARQGARRDLDAPRHGTAARGGAGAERGPHAGGERPGPRAAPPRRSLTGRPGAVTSGANALPQRGGPTRP